MLNEYSCKNNSSSRPGYKVCKSTEDFFLMLRQVIILTQRAKNIFLKIIAEISTRLSIKREIIIVSLSIFNFKVLVTIWPEVCWVVGSQKKPAQFVC